METALKHKSEFVNDTENILNRLNQFLIKDSLIISKIFREIHSLKGAAGFAGLNNMESVAHTLEEVLLNIKKGQQPLTSEIENIIFLSQSYFVDDIESWKLESNEIDNSEILKKFESISQVSEPLSIQVVETNISGEKLFTDFEETLLKEAMFRGEELFRVICHIDHEEEMKYPRLFLVVNNLEKMTNVIKTEPPMADVSLSNSKEITLYLTTGKTKGQIYKALNFDRITEVEIQRLQYSSYLLDFDDNIKANTSLYGKTIEVDTNKIEELYNYIEDLNQKLILEDIILPEKKSVVEGLISQIKSNINGLTTISVLTAFSDFESYCLKVAKELDKKVNFKFVAENILIERKTAEIIKEILIQLIKNSLDHGIETAQERIENGKNPEGNITLTIKVINSSIAISLEDDGRGVDRKEILKKSMLENVIDESEEQSILSILSRPGFTTSEAVNYYSGRGLGLDIVVNRVINRLDGKITMKNSPNKGLCINILVPPENSVVKYTIFKYRNFSFAVSENNLLKKVKVEKENVIVGDNKSLNYKIGNNIYPVYTPWGRLSSSSNDISEPYGFIIRYLGKRAFMPVGEFILEKEYLSSVISIVDTENNYHKQVNIGKKLEKFMLLMPSIINN